MVPCSPPTHGVTWPVPGQRPSAPSAVALFLIGSSAEQRDIGGDVAGWEAEANRVGS